MNNTADNPITTMLKNVGKLTREYLVKTVYDDCLDKLTDEKASIFIALVLRGMAAKQKYNLSDITSVIEDSVVNAITDKELIAFFCYDIASNVLAITGADLSMVLSGTSSEPVEPLITVQAGVPKV